ncbi:hypothetical protein E1202_30285 [Saccharopolyspora karakumensis]|uniref:Uncharacterized protein n=1 Tax=Saccharopolyspora karakumensis TaxID=2530386 RepID=A0A4V2YV84_9PSEU|nr:hypothetical protein [Saccharopolyspora karakumensis]TDD80547.1 hypothetical protein E1202_30285 [Saccharopolyspora karakumensis]
MTTQVSRLSWPLIVLLGVFALVRPVLNITGAVDALGRPLGPVLVTVVISVVWLAAVVWRRSARPVLTLACAGLVYGVLAVALSAVLPPLLRGELMGPLPTPGGIGVVMVLLANAVWGATVGLVALAVRSWWQPNGR